MNDDEMFVDPGEIGVEVKSTKYGRIPEWVLLDQDIIATDKVVYGYLMLRADNTSHRTHPMPRRRIAADLGMSVRTLSRSLNSLADAGMICVEVRKRESPSGEPWYDWSVYTVIFDERDRTPAPADQG